MAPSLKGVGSNAPCFNIEGTDISASFLSGTNRIYIFCDTIGVNANYKAADPVAWSTSAEGETGSVLNSYTNSDGSNVFVDPATLNVGR